MSSEDKQFPASDFKLDNLRRQGVFPFSYALQLFSLVLALPLAIWCTTELGLEKFVRLVQASRFPSSDLQTVLDLKSHAAEALQLWLVLAISMLSILGAIQFLSGALQTKFFFSLGQIKFDFSRLFAPGFFLGWRRRVVLVFPLVALSAMVLYLLFTSIYYFVPRLGDLLNPSVVSATSESSPGSERLEGAGGLAWFSTDGRLSSLAELGNQVQELFQTILQLPGVLFFRYWMYAAFATLFVGVISRLCAVLIFRYENRMTRAEVEAENKENEPNAQFRKMRF